MADPARPSDEIQLAEGDSSMAHSRHNEQQLDSDDEEHHSGNPYMQPHAHGHRVSQDGSLAQPYLHNAQHQYSQHQQHYTDHHYTDADIHQSHIHPTGDAQYGSDDEEDDEDDDMDEDHDESSELELPEAEEDIDYDVVYALHTFLATVEGQASVVKGDQLTLLDDSNSYWWLVRVLKTQLVGYIPAENIETPEERLARFYKKQNLNQTRARESDIAHGAVSARRARTHFVQPHHPTNKMLQESQRRPPMQLNPELPGGGRFVDFGPPSFQEYVGYSYSDEESEGSMEEGEEGGAEFDDEEQGSDGSFEGGSLEDDEHAHGRIHGHPHQQATYAEESAMQTQDNGAVYPLETEQDMIQRYQGQPAGAHSDDIYNRGYDGQAQEYGHEQAPSAQHQQPLQPTGRVAQAQAQAALGVANGGRPAQYGSSASVQESQQQYFQQSTLARKLSVDERLGAERDMAQAGHHPPGQASSIYSGGTAVSRERTPPGVTSTSRLKAFTEDAGSASPTTSQESETKKISLTPKIARDDSTDSNLSEAGASARSGSQSLQPHQQRQPLRNVSNASSANADVSNVSSTFSGNGSAFGRGTPTQGGDSEDRSHFRRGSAGSAASSVNSGMSANSAQKRGASPASDMSTNAHTKKKKSGGILGGLFSRSKKDKKEEKDKKGSQRKNSESTSDEERVSLNSSPAPESPEREKGRASPSGGLVSQQLQQRRAQQQAQEDMFGNEAARRQQQVEAQSVMYQAYGIHPRGPGDATNSSTFSATITPPASAPEDAQPGGASELAAQRIAATQGQMAVSPSQTSMQSSMSYNHSLTGRQLRPGSLIGSPHMANSGGSGEVPVLNVLRVFAGDNIVADATFKTVLLNESTSTEELVKQAMQRFRLAPPVTTDETISSMDAIMQEYYLTAKESDGEETRLHAGQKPLTVFEKLSQAAGYLNSGRSLPSVKRSSVGSISSISSTLSMNPAIEKLRMSDFSDDSQVKLFINRRSTQSPGGSKRTSDSSSTGTITGRRISDDLQLDANRLSGSHGLDKGHGVSPTSPLMRFAVKILIHPADLPDSMAFDPFSHSLIARSALADREQQASRSPSMSSLNVTSSHRERIMFFPRNANVSEILETALDRFGIVEGVVDGGDEVDSKILKRRSMSRIRYSLAAIRPDSLDQEITLNPSSKLLDAYSQPPNFKPYERSSKEFRRRSMETPFNTPSSADILPSDPVFIIRKAGRNHSFGSAASLRARDDSNNSLYLPERAASRSSGSGSVYATPLTEVPPGLERAMSPQQAKQEIIAAQRAASRANQRAMLSAHKNERQGVDVVLSDRSLIRSSRDGANTRYSYIAADGSSEVDISEIVENEWRSDSQQSEHNTAIHVPPRDSPSAMSHVTAESYTSALASPLTPAAYLPGYYNAKSESTNDFQDHDAEEKMAIEQVARAPLTYDQTNDYLEQALSTRTATGVQNGQTTASDSIDQRLERVLSKVRNGGVVGPAGVASALRSQQQKPSSQADASSYKSLDNRSAPSDSGRSTPATITGTGQTVPDRGPSYVSQMMRARSGSATSWASGGRSSPAPQILDRLATASARSTPQPEAPPSSGSSTPRRVPSKGHVKQPSLASIASDTSSIRSRSPSTPATVSVGNTTSTPVSSTRNDSSSSHRLAIPYRDDLGLEFLMQLVDLEAGHVKLQRAPPLSVMDALNNDRKFPQLSPGLALVYDKPQSQLDDLDKRLDQLLNQVMNAV